MANLQSHVSGQHFVARPILLFGGGEPAEGSVLRSPTAWRSLLIANATAVQITIDGGTPKSIPSGNLANELLKLRHADVSISLSNSSQVHATPINTRYDLSIRIADPTTLKNVEIAFSEMTVSGMLTRSIIERFLNDRRCQGLGKDYADGFANFCLGILLKERPSSECLTTPFARYRESYGAALRILSGFERPLSHLVADIIRFALNDFSQPRAATGYWELDLASRMLKDPETRDLPVAPDKGSERRKVCPVDHGTGQILDLAVRMARQDRWSPILSDVCRQIANSELLDAVDRQKALAIWAIAAWRLGARDQAIEPLRQIAATYPFRTWAEPYLEIMT
ncbi:hypothetical protein BST63_15475 [Bradyrhizobium canariense]|uniref:Uncharacterized protein n=1 Tax=Bradyrhizobium canariense TaxID=255045 RepID=A0ABX3X392_9BRAD|nr:hypothetical protein [Bradyrhizobium canariense]OSJ19454.1 hypothetical protein BSR47_02825 [Bradyrhizobium canariense]OSJ28926.1 hypothetical protein BST63_15475 [Bradyrhizobium canariense]